MNIMSSTTSRYVTDVVKNNNHGFYTLTVVTRQTAKSVVNGVEKEETSDIKEPRPLELYYKVPVQYADYTDLQGNGYLLGATLEKADDVGPKSMFNLETAKFFSKKGDTWPSTLKCIDTDPCQKGTICCSAPTTESAPAATDWTKFLSSKSSTSTYVPPSERNLDAYQPPWMLYIGVLVACLACVGIVVWVAMRR